MIRSLLPIAAIAAALALPGAAQAKTKRCGSFHTSNGAKVTVFRVKGHVKCSTGKRIAHAAIGARCEGEVVKKGWHCTHGAPALNEPRASGFTLRKHHAVFEARVR